MSSKLQISLQPIPLDQGSNEEKATFGQLQITADNRILTAGIDLSGGQATPRPGPYISGCYLAEWLVWNWWRLRYEPEPREEPSPEWQMAHCLASSGYGYHWPDITIATKADITTLTAKPTGRNATQFYHYTEEAIVIIPATALETAIDDFARAMLKMAEATRTGEQINLSLLIEDLVVERNDTELAQLHRRAAKLDMEPSTLEAKTE